MFVIKQYRSSRLSRYIPLLSFLFLLSIAFFVFSLPPRLSCFVVLCCESLSDTLPLSIFICLFIFLSCFPVLPLLLSLSFCSAHSGVVLRHHPSSLPTQHLLSLAPVFLTFFILSQLSPSPTLLYHVWLYYFLFSCFLLFFSYFLVSFLIFLILLFSFPYFVSFQLHTLHIFLSFLIFPFIYFSFPYFASPQFHNLHIFFCLFCSYFSIYYFLFSLPCFSSTSCSMSLIKTSVCRILNNLLLCLCKSRQIIYKLHYLSLLLE